MRFHQLVASLTDNVSNLASESCSGGLVGRDGRASGVHNDDRLVERLKKDFPIDVGGIGLIINELEPE